MFDFVIIGSGVSGGRIAYDLTAAGAKCLLLEAGKDFNASTFPEEELDYSTQMFWGGGLEVSADGHLGFLRAKCVGGTSVVNQALLNRFDDMAWDDWRSRTGIADFSSAKMTGYYDRAEQSLSVVDMPAKYYNRNAKILTGAFEKLGYGWEPLHRAQTDCKTENGTDCIVCLGGCRRDSKQSTLVTWIRAARKKGLVVRAEFEVNRLEYGKDDVKIVGTEAGKPAEIRAPQVVLAAGTFGNTKILSASGFKKKLPALGNAFCCHPQFMTYARFDEPVDAHKGAFQCVEGHDPRFRQMGLKFENVYAPPVGTAMLMPGYGHGHQRLMKNFRYYASMEVAIRDEPAGKIQVSSGGKLKISKPLTDADRKKAQNGLKLVREFFEAAGAKEIVVCEQGFGLHLMGGCAIGSDIKSAVVDPEFRVHGFPRIFAADSSIFPTAPGINPSFTIMALSAKASESMRKGA